MNDLISRQAAIDALIRWYGCEPSDIDDFRRIIEELPSAQPEITRCHECAKCRTLDCPMGITVFDAPPSDGYCYKAERRQDETD